MQRQVTSVLLWRHWRFRGVFQFCNSPEPLDTWLPRLACGNRFQVSMHFYKCVVFLLQEQYFPLAQLLVPELPELALLSLSLLREGDLPMRRREGKMFQLSAT